MYVFFANLLTSLVNLHNRIYCRFNDFFYATISISTRFPKSEKNKNCRVKKSTYKITNKRRIGFKRFRIEFRVRRAFPTYNV